MALRRQLEETGEEKKSLQSQLEQRTHEEMKTKDLIEEKEMELNLLKQETQQVTLIIVCVFVCACVCVCTCLCERQSCCQVANINYIQNRNVGD